MRSDPPADDDEELYKELSDLDGISPVPSLPHYKQINPPPDIPFKLSVASDDVALLMAVQHDPELDQGVSVLQEASLGPDTSDVQKPCHVQKS